MRKLLTAGVALFLGLGVANATYFDVDGQNKYATAIDFVSSKNIVEGYPDGSYKPFQPINRAELTKIIVGAIYDGGGTDYSYYADESCFKDVTANQWYTKYVCFAKKLNIVQGYPDGTFKPGQNVNFVEALKIVLNAFAFQSESTEIWYKGYVNTASTYNFIPLDIVSFSQDFNRGQMAELITRVLKYKDGVLKDYLDYKYDIFVNYETIIQGKNMEEFNGVSSGTKKYSPVDFQYEGAVTDAYLGVGEKLRISDDLNIRIDDIIGSGLVKYSIWGESSNGVCSLISSTGLFSAEFVYQKFREFTDSFIEYIEIKDNKVHLKQYYGKKAKERCDEIADWRKPIACSFYPRENYSYISNGKFRLFADKSVNSELTEFTLDLTKNCYDLYEKKIPRLASVVPFNSFVKIYFASKEGYSADYERIAAPTFLTNPDSLNLPDFKARVQRVKAGECLPEYPSLTHELGHLLFATTPLQDVYDAGIKNEVSGKKGLADMAEGFAEFMPYSLNKDLNNEFMTNYYDKKAILKCGTDRLLDIGDQRYLGATEDQMKYSTILAGKGFNRESTYDMGFCFYNRIKNKCGDGGILKMIDFGLDYAGGIDEHKPILKGLADYCGEENVKAIMNDFGLDLEILGVMQKNPNQGFPNNLNFKGCI